MTSWEQAGAPAPLRGDCGPDSWVTNHRSLEVPAGHGQQTRVAEDRQPASPRRPRAWVQVPKGTLMTAPAPF